VEQISLRDYLAGKALEGCCEKAFSDTLLERLGTTHAAAAAMASAAYQIADACLQYRKLPPAEMPPPQAWADLLDACRQALGLARTLRGMPPEPDEIERVRRVLEDAIAEAEGD
jgi:hypothetical protein